MNRKIWISTGRIAGKDNVETDFESRNINIDMEWRLDPDLLECLREHPWLVLFPFRLNHQFTKFASDAFAIDAFNIN